MITEEKVKITIQSYTHHNWAQGDIEYLLDWAQGDIEYLLDWAYD